MRNKFLILAAVALFLMFPCLASGEPSKSGRGKSVKTAYVKIMIVGGDAVIREGFSQNTSLEALQRVVLYPRVTGRLDRLNVTKGMTVKVGQQVAVLAHAEQDAQIVSAQAAVARTQAEWENARIELQRYQRLKKEGFSTQQQLESKDTAYRSAKAQYDAARSELNRLEVTKNEYIIKASINGAVLNDYSLVPGAMLSANTPVMELANLDTLKATFKVPENRFFSVRRGMFVLLRMDALPKEEFRAQIMRIDDYVDPLTRTAGVEAHLDNSSTGNKLRPGMFGRAFVIEQEAFGAFVVPSSALRKDENDVETLALNLNGTAKVIRVKAGIRQGLNVQILEGLKHGDEVIVFGGNALRDGDPVEVMK